MSDLLEKLKAGASTNTIINWPGTEEKIGMRVLTEDDYLRSAIATDYIFKDTRIGMMEVDGIGVKTTTSDTEFETEKSTQLLYRTCFNLKTEKPITKTIDEFRKLLKPGVFDKLDIEMDNFQEENSPNPAEMEQGEFDKLMIDIKKKPEETLLSVSSISTLKRLIMYLVKPSGN